MATLNSPGVSVTVVNDSYYTPAPATTTPLIIVASAENKSNSAGTGIAPGSIKANAGVPYLISSQRNLVDTFGEPTFQVDATNNPVHASELNEYGLQAAYSYMGAASSAWVIRADIDLNALKSTTEAPAGTPANNTLWMDINDTQYGIFQWDSRTVSSGGQSYNHQVPMIINETTKVSAGIPEASVGSIGQYAVVNQPGSNVLSYYYKAAYVANQGNTGWVKIGSDDWVSSWPVVVSNNSTAPATGGITIRQVKANGTNTSITYSFYATTLSQIAADLSAAFVAADMEVLATLSNGKLAIYATSKEIDYVTITNSSGTPLTTLGIVSGNHFAPKLQISKHTQVPTWKIAQEDRPTGSIWIKTTEPNQGTRYRVKRYNSNTQLWNQLDAPLYSSNAAANAVLDATGGLNIPVNTVYVKYNANEFAIPEADFSVETRVSTGITTVSTVAITDTTFAADSAEASFVMSESLLNGTYSSQTTIMFDTTGSGIEDARNLALAINNAHFVNIVAEISATNQVVIKHTAGGEIKFGEAGVNNTLNLLGLHVTYTVPSGDVNNVSFASGWYQIPANLATDPRIAYLIYNTAPAPLVEDGTLWYNAVKDEADIMVHDGSTWKGYFTVFTNTDPNGPIVAASEPTTYADGVTPINALSTGQLWIDTSDWENYPVIKRWDGDMMQWSIVDNSDQTTENGILFGDARWATDGSSIEPASIQTLLTSDFLDFDAPDPDLYPAGMLLFNLRRSMNNVKEYKRNYIDTNADNIRYNNNESMADYYPHRWVSAAPNDDNGSGRFGRKSQRAVVVKALASLINANQSIRDTELRKFNLIATPGYIEVADEMVSLNYDRGVTAFVVGDCPARLTPDSTSLNNWGLNAASALSNGEDGLVTYDDYLGVFYPWGVSTDNVGNTIAVPPSHMMLRTISQSDNVSHPWFAPAGTRRGGITNATNVGYVTTGGEFVAVSLNEGQRDALYNVKINPITYFSGAGLLNWGQKTRAHDASAMDRINVSRLVIYMRGQLDTLAKPYVFEPNDKVTRDSLKNQIDQMLLELTGLRALYDSLCVCDTTNNTPTTIDRNELHASVFIKPTKAAEFIYIPITLKNTGASMTG